MATRRLTETFEIDVASLPADCVYFVKETTVDIGAGQQRKSVLVMGKRQGVGFLELGQWHKSQPKTRKQVPIYGPK